MTRAHDDSATLPHTRRQPNHSVAFTQPGFGHEHLPSSPNSCIGRLPTRAIARAVWDICLGTARSDARIARQLAVISLIRFVTGLGRIELPTSGLSALEDCSRPVVYSMV